MYFGSSSKEGIFCSDECAKSCDKELKSELEKAQNKLQNKKNQTANTGSPAKKNELEKKINDLENHIKDLEKKRNQKNFTKATASPKEGHEKVILIGVGIFSAVVLTTILIIRKKGK